MDKTTTIKTLIATLVVVLLTLLVYWPGLSGSFVLDDITNIANTYVARPDWAAVKYTLSHNTSGLLGRGVSAFSFILSGLEYGRDPWGFKLHNLLLHLANGLLLFRLLYLLLVLLKPPLESRRALLVAGITASGWLLHPLLVSTVLYAVQRMMQLSTFFTLCALLVYLSVRRCERPSVTWWLKGWLLFPLCVLLALFSKENGVLVVPYIVLIELVVFRVNLQSLRQQPFQRLWLGVFVALPMLAGAALVLLFFDRFADYSSRTFTLTERLLTELHVVAFYARTILLPRLSVMSLYLDDFPLTTGWDISTVLLLVLLLAVLVCIWHLRARQPVLALGLGFFLVSHLLESTFIPLELVFEHRNYLATAGLLLPPVYYLVQMPMPELKPLRLLLAGWLCLFALLTWNRVQEWSSPDLLIAVAATEHPASSRTRTEYANYLFNQGRNEEGLSQLQQAMQLEPEDAGPVLHQIFFKCMTGERDDAMLARAESLLRRWPVSVYAINGLDNLQTFNVKGKCTAVTLDDINELVDAAIALPDNQSNRQTAGYLLRFKGIYAFHTGQYVAGVVAFRQAHERSGMVTHLSDLFTFELAFGQRGDAVDTLNLVRELNAGLFGWEDYQIEKMQKQLAAFDAAGGAGQNGVDTAEPVPPDSPGV